MYYVSSFKICKNIFYRRYFILWVIFHVSMPDYFVPMFELVSPGDRASFDPRDIIWTNLVEVDKEMLHTKYQSSKPTSFIKEEFWSFPFLFLCSNLWPPPPPPPMIRTSFDPQGHHINYTEYRGKFIIFAALWKANGKMLVLGFLYSKSTPIVQLKNAKNQHVKWLRFSLNTNKYKYPKNCPLKIACSRPWPQVFVPSKMSLLYTIKTHLSGPPVPKSEANMNYIP